MRANKLETALSRDRLACLAPPDMFFSCVVNEYSTQCTLPETTDLATPPAVMSSESESELSTTCLTHGDTPVGDHDGSLGSKYPR